MFSIIYTVGVTGEQNAIMPSSLVAITPDSDLD